LIPIPPSFPLPPLSCLSLLPPLLSSPLPRRREKRVGTWRDFQVAPDAKKVKAAHFKEETRNNGKHGVIQLETWKKKWK
jgi:hypothetical protein